MIKRVVRLYVLSIIIIVVLSLGYTLALHFTQNEGNITYFTLAFGIITAFVFSFGIGRIFKRKIFFYISAFFIVNTLILYLALMGFNDGMKGYSYLKIAIYYVVSLFSGILGAKK